MPRVLLIEDDHETANEIMAELIGRGFDVDWAATGMEGLDKARAGEADAMIVDQWDARRDRSAHAEHGRRWRRHCARFADAAHASARWPRACPPEREKRRGIASGRRSGDRWPRSVFGHHHGTVADHEIEHSRQLTAFSQVALADLVREVGELYESIAEDKQVVLTVGAQGDVVVPGDRDPVRGHRQSTMP